MYVLSQFGHQKNHQSEKGNYIFGETSDILKWMNSRCKIIGFSLSRQTDKTLPRTHFPTGYIFGKKRKKNNSSGKNW